MLTKRCGVDVSSPLHGSSCSGVCNFTLLGFLALRIVTLLDFLFFWFFIFLLVVFFCFYLCGLTLLGFLVGLTIPSMNPHRQADRNPREHIRRRNVEES